MAFFKEFRDFAVRGNVMDMAIGVIVGAAFGKIVSSLVDDVLMPPIGYLISEVNFSELKLMLKAPIIELNGEIIHKGVTINYGVFLQSVISFTITAFAIFMLVKGINAMKKTKKEEAAAAAKKSDEVVLLEQIRDLLKK